MGPKWFEYTYVRPTLAAETIFTLIGVTSDVLLEKSMSLPLVHISIPTAPCSSGRTYAMNMDVLKLFRNG